MTLDFINRKDCDADEEHFLSKTNHALVCSGTEADNPCRLGLLVVRTEIGKCRNIVQPTLEESLDVFPRLQQVMDQYVAFRCVAVEERTNCQHSCSRSSSQH